MASSAAALVGRRSSRFGPTWATALAALSVWQMAQRRPNSSRPCFSAAVRLETFALGMSSRASTVAITDAGGLELVEPLGAQGAAAVEKLRVVLEHGRLGCLGGCWSRGYQCSHDEHRGKQEHPCLLLHGRTAP